MDAFLTDIQQFLNDATTITVLRFLVLLLALVWLLTGFQFPDRQPRKRRRKVRGGDC